MANNVITSVVNTPSDQIVTKSGNNDMTGINKFGSATDYTQFTADGTMQAFGTATCFRDELNDLIKGATQNPSSHLVFDYTEGTLDFKDNCDLNDWALMNVQINHDWKLGTDIEPHLHWFQNSVNMPNWMIQYRWQKECFQPSRAQKTLPQKEHRQEVSRHRT
jgi:hypothetical protein